MRTYTYTANTKDITGGSWMRAETKAAHKARCKDACPICGSKPAKGEGHIAHMTPRSRGGLNGPDNTIYFCADCNLRMGEKTLAEFCADLPNGAETQARVEAILAQPLDREEGRRRVAKAKASRIARLRRLGQ